MRRGVQKFDTEAEVRRGDTSEIWGVQFEVLPCKVTLCDAYLVRGEIVHWQKGITPVNLGKSVSTSRDGFTYQQGSHPGSQS